MSAANRGTRIIALVIGVAGAQAALVLAPVTAQAHGLVVGRKDVPIPVWLFAAAASTVLVVSFLVLARAWHRARFEEESWRPVGPRISGLIVNGATDLAAGLIGVALLVVVVWSGLRGTEDAATNFSQTFVFVTFWLGLLVLTVAFGNVFRAFNPWRAIARASGAGFRLIAGQGAPTPLRYPERLGRWPAVIAILGFFWLELAYSVGIPTLGLSGDDLATAALIYSAYTLAGMALFGIEAWLENGEGFSVYFGMFSRLAVFEVREGRLGLRRPLAGTSSWATASGSTALVLTVIGATVFDGAQQGVLMSPIDTVDDWVAGSMSETTAFRLTNTMFLVGCVLAVNAVYWLGVRGMRMVDRSHSARQLARLFAHSFIPIALAYVLAHYFSLFVFQEQAQFTYLLSDPLGNGSNYFGTAGGGIDYSLVSANAVWYVQVFALVAGHVAALTLGHDRAIALYSDPRQAVRSQYWMLSLMVAFTTLGLFLLSSANQ